MTWTILSQSTIKMDKGYYCHAIVSSGFRGDVAIHNKNGQGLLHTRQAKPKRNYIACRNPQ